MTESAVFFANGCSQPGWLAKLVQYKTENSLSFLGVLGVMFGWWCFTPIWGRFPFSTTMSKIQNRIVDFVQISHLKFNIAPENVPSQKEGIVFQPIIFQGRAVKLPGCNLKSQLFSSNSRATLPGHLHVCCHHNDLTVQSSCKYLDATKICPWNVYQ